MPTWQPVKPGLRVGFAEAIHTIRTPAKLQCMSLYDQRLALISMQQHKDMLRTWLRENSVFLNYFATWW